MARGRKRKLVERESNGQARRATTAQLREMAQRAATSQPHRRWLREEQRADPRAGTALGAAYLSGWLDWPEAHRLRRSGPAGRPGEKGEARYLAAERFRRVMADWRMLMAVPVLPASASAQMVTPELSSEADDDGMANERPETDEERRERVLRHYGKAIVALGESTVAGKPPLFVANMVDDFVSRDVWPVFEGDERDGFRIVCRALDSLVALWGLDDERLRKHAFCGERPDWGHEVREIHIVHR